MIVVSIGALGAACVSFALNAQGEPDRAPGGESVTAMALQDPRAYLLAAVEEERVIRSILQAQSLTRPSPDDLHTRMSTTLSQELGDDIDDPEFLRRIIVPMPPSVLPYYLYSRAYFASVDQRAYAYSSEAAQFVAADYPEVWDDLPPLPGVARARGGTMGPYPVRTFAQNRISALRSVYSSDGRSLSDSVERWCEMWNVSVEEAEYRDRPLEDLRLAVSADIHIGPFARAASEAFGVQIGQVESEEARNDLFDGAGDVGDVVASFFPGAWEQTRTSSSAPFLSNTLPRERCSPGNFDGICAPPGVERSIQLSNLHAQSALYRHLQCFNREHETCAELASARYFSDEREYLDDPERAEAAGFSTDEISLLAALVRRRVGVSGAVFDANGDGAERRRGVCFIPVHLANETQDALLAECIVRLTHSITPEQCPFQAFYDPSGEPPALTDWNFYRLPEVVAASDPAIIEE